MRTSSYLFGRVLVQWRKMAIGCVLTWLSAGVGGTTSMAAMASDFASGLVTKTGVEVVDLPYRYLIPSGYANSSTYPLIVYLHGSGERGNNNTAQLGNDANGALQLVNVANQTAFPCFMLAPQANAGEGWNANTLGQVIRAIAQLAGTYSIDRNRIYITGLAMGGAGTWEILSRYPNVFAAAVPMSGTGAGNYERFVGIPVWAFHAANDPTIPVAGTDNAVSALRLLGGRVIYTRYATGGHAIWPTAYSNSYLLPWMMAQRRNQPVAGAPLISINTPAQHLALPPATTSKSVAGSATIPGGISKVNWTFNPAAGNAGVSTSGYGLATGTTSWSVASATVTTSASLFLAVATGPSWATGTGSAAGGGVTTLNDYFWNVPTGANLMAPTVSVVTPTTTGVLTTQSLTLNLTGTAMAAGTKTVSAISWRNNRGGEGFGLGTTDWRIDNIDLQSGDNIVTVTARDSSSITAAVTYTVHVTSDGGNVAPTITAHPANQTVQEFQLASFSVVATGTEPLKYQWRKNGVAIAGATGTILDFPNPRIIDGGVYDVVVTNALGSVVGGPAALTVGPSVNGGGHADMLWENRATGQRSIWLMKGTVFGSGVDLGVIDRNWEMMATADLDGDGQVDILWQNRLTGECSVWLMNGPRLGKGVVLPAQSVDWKIVATGDLNADGKPDVVWQNTTTGLCRVWLMNGTTQASVVDLGIESVAWRIVGTGDFDHDGKVDLLWQNVTTSERRIWLMNGTTLLRTYDLGSDEPGWMMVATGDFNGDDEVDIVWQNLAGQRRIWLMNQFTRRNTVDLGVFDPAWQIVATGDFDGDGRAYKMRPLASVSNNTAANYLSDGRTHLLWQNNLTGEHSLLVMNGTAATSGVDLGTVDPTWKTVALGDFDNDGSLDLVWQNVATGQCSIWLMNGRTLSRGVNLGALDVSWQVVGTGDFNGDDNADLLWQNRVTGQRSVWLMSGTTLLKGVDLGTFEPAWQMVATGDFNSDGKVDILWQNGETGQHSVWLMNGTTLLRGVDLGTLDPAWQTVTAGDFNGDGQTDIVWQNAITGQRSIWLMNGTSLLGGVDLGVYDSKWVIVAATTSKPRAAPKAANSEAEAVRFLIQSTFGPTPQSIAEVRSMSFDAWINQQIALSPTYHLPYYRTRVAELMARDGDDGYSTPRQEAWWQNALTAPDQLRQRVALALSEILVISQVGALDGEHEGVTAYYDLLVQHAFGNYRQLLGAVTLNPMMGTYLSMIRNRKPDPKTGSQPDENYAREIMQLFSIGLSELNLDGTPHLGPDSRLIPTYTQADVVGLAHVFTGWGPNFDAANPPRWDNGTIAKANDWFLWGHDPLRPMTFNTNYGDLQARQIVGGVTVAATLTGPQRMALAMDTLANHANTGPFISRQLIQRLVTSNPSPAYVFRVASIFNNNGSGVRGDLGATVRAILLDPEARRAESLTDPTYGKAVEPLLRQSRILRAFAPTPAPNAATGDRRLFLNFQWEMEDQSPLQSPTVFNFFRPNFGQPGRITASGLVSPEFQIFSDTMLVKGANRNYGLVNWGLSAREPSATVDSAHMDLDFSEPLGVLMSTGANHAQGQAALVEYLNRRLLGGAMSPFLRQRIIDTFAALPSWFDYSAVNELERVQLAVYLVTFSPEFNIQR